MRVFLAGASGVIGQRLIPLLVAGGHTVCGMTRSPAKAPLLRDLGAEPLVCDVYELGDLLRSVQSFQPDVIVHQLTDLPDDAAKLRETALGNARIRTEGTRNLLAAATQARVQRFLAQSIAWQLPAGPAADAVAELEASVLAVDGVVLRYGQFYGPGTYYEQEPPTGLRIHIDAAARRTVEALNDATGVVTIVE